MKEIFDEVLETFENDDIKKFAENIINNAPPYFFLVPSSSTLKYHPAYACTTPLGLAKHTVALVRLLNHMFSVESVANQFTSRERDLLRVAGISHDMAKSGTQEEYEQNKYTKFDHPLRMAAVIRNYKGRADLSDNEIELIAHAVESHMGAFNIDKRYPDVVLPKPEDKYQIILHLADYLASRKDIEMEFEKPNIETEKPNIDAVKPDIETWKIDFGKYKGMTLPEIENLHPDYIAWIQKQEEFNKEPCKSLLIQMGYKFKN